MWEDTQLSWKMAGFFLGCPHALPWHTGCVYKGHTLKQKGKGWLLVVRAVRKDSRVVCFFEGPSPTRCAQAFAYIAVYGEIDWKVDRYA